MTTPTGYRQHLEVETPELVVIDYEIAGLGSRALAAIYDAVLLVLGTIALVLAVGLLDLGRNAAVMAVLFVAYFATLWGYFAFFEAFWHGQTPGKRRVGIRVIRDSGHPVTLGAAALRNLLRIADFMPAGYLLGGVLVGLHPTAKRLGDLVAGTIVVRDRPHEAVAPVAVPTVTGVEAAGLPQLADDEFRLLREFAERAPALPPDVRDRLAANLVQRFAARYPVRPPEPLSFLTWLLADETARRQGRFGGRSAAPAGASDQAPSGGVAERLVARQATRWAEFEQLATRAATAGLDSFAAAELPDFAARYREIAADLARARTYRAPAPVRSRLERLVAAGHNALYRDERRAGRWLWEFLTRECPASILVAWRTVLVAFVTFALPAVAGYLLLVEQPGLAEEVLPPVMLERAEAGRERVQAGRGYYEAEAEVRPLVASQIMTNNIKVALVCFAAGIFAGVGSLLLLAFNGLYLGSATGHFANVGLAGYLWTFVVGHGVLELFAIWLAGAAGFLLGRALLNPGDYRRSDALVLAGRLGVRLVGATVVLLVFAGLIEGFVSASEVPLPYRLAVSGASAVLLLLFLANGWPARAQVRALLGPEG